MTETLTETSAHELGGSFDCRVPGCVNTAVSSKGIYAYLCDSHTAEKRRKNAAAPAPAPAAGGGFTGNLAELQRLARRADKTRADAKALTEKALVAKRVADGAAEMYRRALREAVGEQA